MIQLKVDEFKVNVWMFVYYVSKQRDKWILIDRYRKKRYLPIDIFNVD